MLHGSNLANSRFLGADFRGASFDNRTDFTLTNLNYSALGSGNYESAIFDQHHIESMFGDQTCRLAAYHKIPVHWSQLELEAHQFKDEWRSWQIAEGFGASASETG